MNVLRNPNLGQHADFPAPAPHIHASMQRPLLTRSGVCPRVTDLSSSSFASFLDCPRTGWHLPANATYFFSIAVACGSRSGAILVITRLNIDLFDKIRRSQPKERVPEHRQTHRRVQPL
jgi:integrase